MKRRVFDQINDENGFILEKYLEKNDVERAGIYIDSFLY